MAATKAYIGEFVGTFLLVFTVGCNVLSQEAVWAGVSIGCSLMVGIYALANVSGANFNPAVSVALGVAGALPWIDVALYSVVQLLAGALAGFLAKVMISDSLGGSLALGPADGFAWWQAGMCELLYTFMLCFVVLNTACSAGNNKGTQFYGLSIGFVIVAGAYGAGAVSGGCFNPAVAFGVFMGSAPNKMSGSVVNLPLYFFFQLVGAVLAGVLFQWIEQQRGVETSGARRSSVTSVTTGDSSDDARSGPGLAVKVASEILGTYFLVLTVGLNVLAGSPAGAFSIAASLMVMIFALGDVSGGHFNPAVTTAILAIRKIEAKEAAIYCGAQVFGGILAAITYSLIYSGKSKPFALGPADEFDLPQAAGAEAYFTFVLCFTVLSVACSPSAGAGNYSQVFGLAIGSCVTVGGFAIGKVSGGSLNPAVSWGIAAGNAMFASNFGNLTEGALYTVFELVGAGAAALVYKVTHAVDDFSEPEDEDYETLQTDLQDQLAAKVSSDRAQTVP
jgi:aquaporin Z